MTKHTIEYKGKTYGYWTDATGVLSVSLSPNGVCGVSIRSESNPDKTPYLRAGSPTHKAVLAAIRAVRS
jgi:hypothetical protein